MPKLLTHEEADKQVMEAMGTPTGQAMDAFQRFRSNRGAGQMTKPAVPRLPVEQIKKLPLRTQ